MEFWNDIATDKSWKVLINLKREFDFVLIGGWACYLLTKTVKSKDIDIIVDFETLEKLRKHPLKKTHFLKKYEMVVDEVSIDIYVPFYSRFLIPAEDIMKNTIEAEGFKIPRPEILLILKQQAEIARADSVKGQKDRVDIINLLLNGNVDLKLYKELLKRYRLEDYLTKIMEIVRTARREFEYLNITNLRKIKLLKRKILDGLSNNYVK